MNKQNILVSAIIAIIVVVVAFRVVGGNNQPSNPNAEPVGSAGTRYPHGVSVGTNTATTANGLKLGDNGTEHTKFVSGSCTATSSASTNGVNFMSSTTQEWICLDSAVAAGDKIFGVFDKSTAAPPQGSLYLGGPGYGVGLKILSARATTSGVIGFVVSNESGSATGTIDAVNRVINYWVADN